MFRTTTSPNRRRLVRSAAAAAATTAALAVGAGAAPASDQIGTVLPDGPPPAMQDVTADGFAIGKKKAAKLQRKGRAAMRGNPRHRTLQASTIIISSAGFEFRGCTGFTQSWGALVRCDYLQYGAMGELIGRVYQFFYQYPGQPIRYWYTRVCSVGGTQCWTV